MKLVVVGLSHRTAPVSVRERIAIAPDDLVDVLVGMRTVPGLCEGLMLSTCNRTEIYAHVEKTDRDAARLKEFVADVAKIPQDELSPYLYEHQTERALVHIFRVVSSLDSLVVGESQILGQVKAAYAAARGAELIGGELGRVMERSFVVAKRIRSETAIGKNPLSVSSVAVDLAKTIFGDLRGRGVLLVGAGKMGRLTMKHLRSSGVGTVWIANRSQERAQELLDELALGDGFYVPLDELDDALAKADIVVSSIRPDRWLIAHDQAVRFMRRRRGRPLFLIDIAVPRSIDPAVHAIDNVFVYDIDDLEQVVSDNHASRRAEAVRAEEMVRHEVGSFRLRLRDRDVGPTIRALLGRLEAIRVTELERDRRLRTFSAEDRRVVDEATRAMLKKIAHGAIVELKRSSRSAEGDEVIDALRRAFADDGGAGDKEGES